MWDLLPNYTQTIEKLFPNKFGNNLEIVLNIIAKLFGILLPINVDRFKLNSKVIT